jgi:Ca-activated chloride channel family protein
MIPNSFMHPDRLWWLVLVPVIAVTYILLSHRFSPSSRNRRIARLLPNEAGWKRHLSVGLSLLSLASLIVAYAQPLALTDVPKERATVVVTIDVSRSMQANDVSPNRFDAAKTAAKQFVDMLPASFNVAIVDFAGTASILLPPSTDREAAKNAIDSMKLAPSTAIGEGIYTSLQALTLAPEDPAHPNDPAPGAIVLLSDGSTNTGRSSSDAAEEAKKEGVPIYTIAYGTAGGYVVEDGVRQPVPVNHYELSQVAKISGGKKFSATSASDLSEVYKTIASSVGYAHETTEVTAKYAGIALLCAALAALGVISLAARWP